MKKTLFYIFSFLLTTTIVFANTSGNDQWSRKMVNFIQPVMRIYSIDLHKSEFTNQEKETLSKAIQDLNNTSHGLKFSFINFFSKKDPAIKAEYDQFKYSLDMAEKLMPIDPKQSLFYTQHAIGQCAACHAKGGKTTHLFSLFKDTKISEPEKGRLALAMRDYEASAEIFKKILLEPTLQNDYFKTHRVLVNYVNSSLLAGFSNEQLISGLSESLKLTKNKGTQTDIIALIDDIKDSKALSTLEQAIDSFQNFDGESHKLERSLYSALKIKKIIHEKLKDIKQQDKRAEAYEILGDIYAQFPEISTFMVPENYYELCVKTSPKTDIADECFSKYQTKIILGYSGSMGTNIPEYERAKINTLKKHTRL